MEGGESQLAYLLAVWSYVVGEFVISVVTRRSLPTVSDIMHIRAQWAD